LFHEQKNPWLPYSPYVNKFTENGEPSKDEVVEADEDYDEDEATFRKRQDVFYPNYGGRYAADGSENQIRLRNTPYKVSVDRNPDTYRIGSPRSRLQLTPDTHPDPESYHMPPQQMVSKPRSQRLPPPIESDGGQGSILQNSISDESFSEQKKFGLKFWTNVNQNTDVTLSEYYEQFYLILAYLKYQVIIINLTKLGLFPLTWAETVFL
jgi:hypothetical protein